MADIALRLRISGRVQGVGYRAWAMATAQGLGLRGWVRNRLDGTVEALAVGPEAAVTQFAAACRSGPRLAAVTGVTSEPAQGITGAGFVQKPTV